MADKKNLVLSVNQDLGEIMTTLKIIEIIIGIAASKIEGVYGICGTFIGSVIKLLGRIAHGKGVCSANEEDGLKVDLYYYLECDVSVPRIATEMQEQASQQVLFITDIDLSEVSIYVVAIVPEKLEQPTIEEPFEDEEEGNE